MVRSPFLTSEIKVLRLYALSRNLKPHGLKGLHHGWKQNIPFFEIIPDDAHIQLDIGKSKLLDPVQVGMSLNSVELEWGMMITVF